MGRYASPEPAALAGRKRQRPGMTASEVLEQDGQQATQQSLWRNRDFGLLISGRVVSYVGSQVQIFALPAGALADRWNRKATMIISDLCRAALMISIPVALWLHALTVAQLCVVSVLRGLFATLFNY